MHAGSSSVRLHPLLERSSRASGAAAAAIQSMESQVLEATTQG
jgi:hypothetical protein